MRFCSMPSMPYFGTSEPLWHRQGSMCCNQWHSASQLPKDRCPTDHTSSGAERGVGKSSASLAAGIPSSWRKIIIPTIGTKKPLQSSTLRLALGRRNDWAAQSRALRDGINIIWFWDPFLDVFWAVSNLKPQISTLRGKIENPTMHWGSVLASFVLVTCQPCGEFDQTKCPTSRPIGFLWGNCLQRKIIYFGFYW